MKRANKEDGLWKQQIKSAELTEHKKEPFEDDMGI